LPPPSNLSLMLSGLATLGLALLDGAARHACGGIAGAGDDDAALHLEVAVVDAVPIGIVGGAVRRRRLDDQIAQRESDAAAHRARVSTRDAGPCVGVEVTLWIDGQGVAEVEDVGGAHIVHAADGNRDEPLANYYFGGFGNNWVDHRDVSRYRHYYAFPGIDLNALSGNNFGKVMVEWTLPPVRYQRLGIRSFYTNWTHLRLFSTAISTNMDHLERRRTLVNFGGQMDWKLVLFSTMKSTFSFGFAGAVEKNERPSYEFMVSLKIL